MSSPFQPAARLTHPHAQTIFASLVRQPRSGMLRRERFDTPDGDFIDVDILEAPETAPRLLLLHGLEGSSDSGYIRELVRLARGKEWGAWALNFRGCSGEPNRRAHSYNSGDTTDARFIAGKLKARHPRARRFAAGFSLGGSVVLNLLAEEGDSKLVDAAAAVSVPYDLDACATLLDEARGIGRVYCLRFLRTLKVKGLAKARQNPGLIDPDAVRRASTLRAFDDAVTSQLGGFADAADYYAKCSSGPKVDRVKAPTLLVSAGDDPLAPASHLPGTAAENPNLTLDLPPQGGHVGFVGGTVLAPVWWAEARVMAFFDSHARSPVP